MTSNKLNQNLLFNERKSHLSKLLEIDSRTKIPFFLKLFQQLHQLEQIFLLVKHFLLVDF